MRVFTLAILTACGGGGAGSDGNDVAPTDSGETPTLLPPEPSATLSLTDEGAYTVNIDAELPHTEVPASADATVTWSGLTRALDGGGFIGGDVLSLQVHALNVTPNKAAEQLATNQLDFNDAEAIWDHDPEGRTSAQLTDLVETGHAFDPAYWLQPTEDFTFLALLLDDDLKPMSGATFKRGTGSGPITFDDSATYVFEAGLTGRPLATTPDIGPWTIEWGGLTTDSLGNAVDIDNLEQLFLAWYDVPTAGDAATLLLDAERNADKWWIRYIAGKNELPAEDLTALDGTFFEGFETTGIYVLGLRCSSCTAQVPLYATQIIVVDE